MVEEVKKPTQEEVDRVEKHFIEVCNREFVKWGSKKYQERERFYFCGAIMAFNFAVVKWSVNLISGRPVLNKF